MDAKNVTIGNKTVKQIRLNGETVYNSIVRLYEELEYIEFDGVAEMDLQLDHVSGYEYELDFNMLSSLNSWNPLFGTRPSDANEICIFLGTRNAGFNYSLGYERSRDNCISTGPPIVLGERYNILVTPDKFIVNGERYTNIGRQPNDGNWNHAMYLGNSPGQNFMFRVKDAEGNVVSDCRPARRLSDGECGMFDRARNLFLTRTSERGEITGNYPTGRLY